MSKAIVDPEELRRFAHDLKRFNIEMQSQLSSIQRRFAKLGETWCFGLNALSFLAPVITLLMISPRFVPPVTTDQVELLKTDSVVSGAYPGLPELGITPTTLEAVLPTYLYRYRKGGQYADQEDRELAAQRA